LANAIASPSRKSNTAIADNGNCALPALVNRHSTHARFA
jgi:hypothetical protein